MAISHPQTGAEPNPKTPLRHTHTYIKGYVQYFIRGLNSRRNKIGCITTKGRGPGQRITTGWTVRGSNPCGRERFSTPVQPGPRAHQASCTMGTGSLSRGVKRPGRGVDHPSPSSAEVKESIVIYLYSASAPSWSVLRRTLLF
jgi:hypothetical protein